MFSVTLVSAIRLKNTNRSVSFVKKTIYGEHHGDVEKSYNNLGIVYGKIAQYNLAKEYHEKSLKIIEKRFMVNTMVR